jgi:hypothetical protein
MVDDGGLLRKDKEREKNCKYSELRKIVLEDQETFIERSQLKFSDYERILNNLDDGNPIFCVRVYSLWSGYGDEDVEVKARGGLRAVFNEATNDFIKKNNRRDGIWNYRVFLMGRNSRVELPEKVYMAELMRDNGKKLK